MSAFLLADWIGTFTFALAGFLVGARRGFDILGVLIVSFLTAFGGGILRDVILGNKPLVLTNDYLGATVVLVVFVASIFKINRQKDIDAKALFIISDSIGLVSFAISGAIMAADSGLGLMGSAIVGFITALGGGIMRDVLINEVPFVLTSEFYGTVALVAGIGVYFIYQFNEKSDYSLGLLFIACLALRLIAWRMNWKLPKFGGA
jgi:uncharacterized membrane protein YeiH